MDAGSLTINDDLPSGYFVAVGLANPNTVAAANTTTPVEYVRVIAPRSCGCLLTGGVLVVVVVFVFAGLSHR